MRRTVLAMGMVFYATAAMAQVNPCTIPIAFQANPDTIYVEWPEFNALEIDGQPLVNQAQFALFQEGQGPSGTPIQGPSTLPRNSFTAVQGFANCYQVNLPGTIPSSQRLVGYLRGQRTPRGSIPALDGAWGPASNPFGSARTAPLSAPGQTRVSQ